MVRNRMYALAVLVTVAAVAGPALAGTVQSHAAKHTSKPEKTGPRGPRGLRGAAGAPDSAASPASRVRPGPPERPGPPARPGLPAPRRGRPERLERL